MNYPTCSNPDEAIARIIRHQRARQRPRHPEENLSNTRSRLITVVVALVLIVTTMASCVLLRGCTLALMDPQNLGNLRVDSTALK